MCFTLAFASSVLALDPLSLIFGQGNPEDVGFYLYSNSSNYSLEAGVLLDLNNNSTIRDAYFIPNALTTVIIHGYGNNYTCWFPQEVKDLYFQNNLARNIIAVDWGKLAANNASEVPSYIYGANNVNIVADRVGKLVVLIQQLRNIPFSSFHLVGWSLGAHVAGAAGYTVQTSTGQNVSRVTGLDPAGPGFFLNSPICNGSVSVTNNTCGIFYRQLTPTDGSFVDTVHTDRGEYGTLENDGQCDFFMNNNGLMPQPNCPPLDLTSFCSHQAAPKYFMQSIGNKICATRLLPLSNPCNRYNSVPFGDSAKPGTTGSYYLNLTPMNLTGQYPGF